MKVGKGIVLNKDNDLLVIGGKMVVGNTKMQEVALIAQLRSGELKSDPVLGPNLIQLLKSNASRTEIAQRLRVHLARDGKDYNDIKKYLDLNGFSI